MPRTPRITDDALTRDDLRAIDPAEALSGGLCAPAKSPDGTHLRPELGSIGALALMEQLRADGTPRDALDLLAVAFDQARDGLRAGRPLGPDDLAALQRRAALQAAGSPTLERWTPPLVAAVSTPSDLDAAVRLLERARAVWIEADTLRGAAPPASRTAHAVDVIRRTESGTHVVCRAVVTADGAFHVVPRAPRGEVALEEHLQHGIPAAGGTLRPQDGLRFLEALSTDLRGSRLFASKVRVLDEAQALTPYDKARPAPEVVVTQVRPHEEVLYVLNDLDRATVGAGCDVALPVQTPGVVATLLWKDGWLWLEPGENAIAATLSGLALSVHRGATIPIDPGATLVFGDRAVRIDYPA